MESSTATGLQQSLTEIAEIDAEIKELNDKIDALKERRDELEQVAIKRITEEGLDGCKVAGRSWRVEWTHSFSAPEATKDVVMRAAAREGLLETVTQVNTARLKAILTERAKDAGTDARALYSDGTAFEGLVGEYVAPKLRFVAAR